MNFIRTTFLILIAILLHSCMLKGKIDKVVRERYAGRLIKPKSQFENLTLSTDSLAKLPGFSKTKYNRFFIVPLIIYNYSEERIKCELNPNIFINPLVLRIDSLLGTDTIKSKLAGKKIELAIDHMPLTFHHKFQNHFVALEFVLGRFTFSYTKNDLFNRKDDLRIRYIIRDNEGKITDTGHMAQISREFFYKKEKWTTRKSHIRSYLKELDTNIDFASRSIAEELIIKLLSS